MSKHNGDKGGTRSGSTSVRYLALSGLQRDSSSVVTRAGGEERRGSYCSRGAEFQYGEMNMI